MANQSQQHFTPGLEPARQDYPEVASHPPPPPPQPYPIPYSYQPSEHYSPSPKPETPPQNHAQPLPGPVPVPPSTYGSQTLTSPHSTHARPVPPDAEADPGKPSSRTILGCSALVFVLSCIIALLSAAVIGLAAATGIEAQRASSAQSSLAAYSSSVGALPTGTAAGGASATQTAVAVIDDGCSTDPDGVTGTVYTSFALLGALRFSRHCNRDAPNAPLLSLFTANFATCMDACAAYTSYVPKQFGNAANATCEAVSFIPAWTSKVIADAGGAKGNCYLKPGPQNVTGLEVPNIGVDCHAAILVQGG